VRRRWSKDELIQRECEALVREGWTIEIMRKHAIVRRPDGIKVAGIPKTPSDRRSGLNWLSQIRRARVAYTGRKQ
jgi:hypothetical protein